MTAKFLEVNCIAKVVGNRSNHEYAVGDTVTIIEVDEPDTYLTYLCRSRSTNQVWWLSYEDVVALKTKPGEDCIF